MLTEKYVHEIANDLQLNLDEEELLEISDKVKYHVINTFCNRSERPESFLCYDYIYMDRLEPHLYYILISNEILEKPVFLEIRIMHGENRTLGEIVSTYILRGKGNRKTKNIDFVRNRIYKTYNARLNDKAIEYLKQVKN